MIAAAVDPAPEAGGRSGVARRLWWAAPFVAAMLALWIAAIAGLALRDPAADRAYAEVSAAPVQRLRAEVAATSATELREVAPQDAVSINAGIPVADVANPAARPFIPTGNAADRLRSLDCLAAAIYYEAARETTDGQRGVAQVVLNRVRHPAYPDTVCGVVFEGSRRVTGCQFSFTCDGSLRRAPMAGYWDRARAVAEAALAGYVHAPVGWATHYHANYVVPYWASSLVKSATIGTHIFYRWRGGWGRPGAFLNRYAGAEPAIAWRGGFGQPDTATRLAGDASGRDAAAAEAAQQVNGAHSIDSFQRSVLRRYEPLARESATEVIAQRARADRTMSASQRWALTGEEEAEAPQQRPLGRWGVTPPERPARVAPPAPAPTPTPAPEAGASEPETAR